MLFARSSEAFECWALTDPEYSRPVAHVKTGTVGLRTGTVKDIHAKARGNVKSCQPLPNRKQGLAS